MICQNCGSERYWQRDDVAVELWCSGTRLSTTDLRGTAFVCCGCGKLELLVANQERWARRVGAKEVNFGPGSTYRG